MVGVAEEWDGGGSDPSLVENGYPLKDGFTKQGRIQDFESRGGPQ